MKREVDIVVLSDIHLGTYGCHARELHNYLKSVQPKTLILNGDIFDIWNFKKSYFPKEHMEIVRRLLKMAVDGTKVYYLTGNHDDLLRKFGEMSFGLIELRNKLVFQLDGKVHWVFHGDVFDASIQRARWLAQLGGKSYDLLIWLNRAINQARNWLGYPSVSFAANIKKGVKGAVKYMGDFENTAIELAAEKGYDYVLCGHIHRPQMQEVTAANGHKVTYLNSGDWVEHLTSLEFHRGKWSVYQYDTNHFEQPGARKFPRERARRGYQLSREEVLPEPGVSAAAMNVFV